MSDAVMTANVTIRIQQSDFDVAQEIAALTEGRSDVGAVVSFTGICRGSEDGAAIAALTLEHYPGMAMSRWELSGIRVIHRVGRITPGENIVLVVTASKHRQAAFEAAEFLMDYLKANAPFWKRVDGADGTDWIEARDHDETAARRWTKS
jgi:molybdopterin synthase catalytic subunit